jgi:hypothetical protein
MRKAVVAHGVPDETVFCDSTSHKQPILCIGRLVDRNQLVTERHRFTRRINAIPLADDINESTDFLGSHATTPF